MRILLCIHQFFPEHTLGTERYTLGLARALRELGHDVQVHTGAMLPQSPDFLARYDYEGIPVSAVNFATSPPDRFEDDYRRPDLAPLHREVIDDFQPDLVHVTHVLRLGLEFFEVCRQAGVPVVMTFTDLWNFCWAGQCIRPCDSKTCRGPDADKLNCVIDYLRTETPSGGRPILERTLEVAARVGLARPVYRAIRRLPEREQRRVAPDIPAVADRNHCIRQALQNVSHAFFPSTYLRDACAANGMEFANSTVLPYGIRPPTPAEREALCRPREAGPPVFAFLGQLARHKGLHILLEAFQQAAIPGAQLKIHGRFNPGDPHAPALREHIEMTDDATLEGYFPGDEIYRILAECDAVVIPSLWHENAPLALLEALSAGKPAIISDGKGMVEFVKDGETGLITRTGSSSSLAAALRRFAEMGNRLPGVSPDRPAYTLSPEDHARILAEEHYQRLARPFGSSPEMQTRGLDLGQFVHMESVCRPEPVQEPGQMVWNFAQARVRGCELRLPNPTAPFPPAMLAQAEFLPASGPEKLAAGAGKRGQSRTGRTFPREFPPSLLLRMQNKPFLSLWGRRPRGIKINRLYGFKEAETLEIIARAKLAKRSRLEVQASRKAGKESSETEKQTWTWNWPTQGWTRITLHLGRLRAAGYEDLMVEWIPVDSRDAWKLDLLQFALAEVATGKKPALSRKTTQPRTNDHLPRLIRWKTIEDYRGHLTVGEFPESLPFPPQRVYWVYDIPAGVERGGHAHREIDEVIVPLSGGFTISLTNADGETREYRLNDPDSGLFLPRGWWRNIHSYEPDSVCMVISSGPYREDEYLRDPETFFKNGQKNPIS